MVGSIFRSACRRGTCSAALAVALVALAATVVAAPAEAGLGGVSATPAAPAVPPTTAPAGRLVYPIRGAHELWDGFGAGRGHDGADVGAACGTPLVAIGAGKVRFVKSHARAGNYLVLDLAESTYDLMYAHLQETAVVLPGQSVVPGQVVGAVGDTGNASGCHLHFELWEGAYYGGGAPIDPVPFLASLDRERKRLAKRANGRNR